MSTWFLLCTVVRLAVHRHRQALRRAARPRRRRRGTRATLEEYSSGFLRIVLAVSCGAALVTYCIWAFETKEIAGQPTGRSTSCRSCRWSPRCCATRSSSSRATAPRRRRSSPTTGRCRCSGWSGSSSSAWGCTSDRDDVAGRRGAGRASPASTAGCRPIRRAAVRRRRRRARPAARSSRSAASAAGRTIVLASAAPDGVASSRSTRMPATTAARRRSRASPTQAADDHEVVHGQPRGGRRAPTGSATSAAFSDAAHPEVARPIDVLYIDGAHRYAPGARRHPRLGRARRRRRHAADPRLVLLGRRHAGDPARARVRPALPLRRPGALAGDYRADLPRRLGRRGQQRCASSPSCRGSPRTSPSRSADHRARAGCCAASAGRVPEWPY